MYQGLLHSHSLLRYILLIVLLLAVVNAFRKWQGNKPFSPMDNKLSLFALIFTHVQVLIGIVLYVISPLVKQGLSQMPETMSDTILRFWVVEHLVGMLIAAVLITIGRARSKRQTTDAGKNKQVAIWMGIGLILIIASIPWPFRELGKAWF